MLSVEDRLDIHRLLSLTSYLIDGNDWQRLSEVFTSDFVSDATGVGYGRNIGLDEVIAKWSANHTRKTSHHSLNVMLAEVDGSTVRAQSKGSTVYAPDDVHTMTHHDVIVRTNPAGASRIG